MKSLSTLPFDPVLVFLFRDARHDVVGSIVRKPRFSSEDEGQRYRDYEQQTRQTDPDVHGKGDEINIGFFSNGSCLVVKLGPGKGKRKTENEDCGKKFFTRAKD